jgi:hypothetical protein
MQSKLYRLWRGINKNFLVTFFLEFMAKNFLKFCIAIGDEEYNDHLKLQQ